MLDIKYFVTHCVSMKTISIRELHAKTGKWVREAATSHEALVVLDRGRPTARLLPYSTEGAKSFAMRRSVNGFEDLPEFTVDSGTFLEEERK